MRIFIIVLILFFTFPLIGRAQEDTASTAVLTNTTQSSEDAIENEISDDSGGLIAEEDGVVLDDDEYEEDDAGIAAKLKKEQTIEQPAVKAQEATGLSSAQKEKLAAEKIKEEMFSGSKKAKEKEAERNKNSAPKHDWRFKDPSKRKTTANETSY